MEPEHNELEERMGPDVQQESSAYDFQSRNGAATDAQRRQGRKNGSPRQALQQR